MDQQVFWRIRVVRLRERGLSYTAISREIERQGFHISPKTVKRLAKCESEKPYRACILNEFDYSRVVSVVERLYKTDSEIKTPEVLAHIEEEEGIRLNRWFIMRIRKKLGLKHRQTRHGHSVRDANRPIRVRFCQHMIDSGDDLSDYIFGDECQLQVHSNSRTCFAQKEDLDSRVKPRKKFPEGVMIWGAISSRGHSDLYILRGKGKVDSAKYQEIIRKAFVPFNEEIYNGQGILVQDKAPCHVSASTRAFFSQADIKWLESYPPESPDLNPVEYVWAEMKEYIYGKMKPKTRDELIECIEHFWATQLTLTKCRNYVNHVEKNLAEVIKRNGGPVVE